MKTLEVIVIYLAAYASLVVVIGVALYMVALEARDRLRSRSERHRG